ESNPMLEMEDEFNTPDNSTENEADYPRQQEIKAADGADENTSDSTKETNHLDAENYGDHDTFSEGEAIEWNESIPQELPVDTSWDDVYQSSSSGSSNFEGEDNDFESRRTVADSLHDHLLWQLNLTPMSDVDRIIAMAIIDAVDASGMSSARPDDI